MPEIGPIRGESPSYGHSKEKRFEVSPDLFSQERIKLLRELDEDLSNSLPEYVGITFHGSLSKGKKLEVENKDDSDIDLNIFVDKDMLQREFPGNDRPSEIEGYLNDYLDHWDKSHAGSQDRMVALRKYFRESIKDRFGKVELHGDPGLVIALGEEAFEDKIRDLNRTRNRDHEYYWKGLKGIARLFHLGIGSNLNKYRKQFLEMLQEEEEGEEMWHDLVEIMKKLERGSQQDGEEAKKLLFPPDNIEEAINFY